MMPDTSPNFRPRWLSLASAAALLDMTAGALRRKVERHADVAEDGVIEAEIDGIRARKFGRTWRVLLGPRWLVGQGTP